MKVTETIFQCLFRHFPSTVIVCFPWLSRTMYSSVSLVKQQIWKSITTSNCHARTCSVQLHRQIVILLKIIICYYTVTLFLTLSRLESLSRISRHSDLFSMIFHKILHNCPRPMPDSRTLQDWKVWTINSTNYHIFPGSVRTLMHAGGRTVGQPEMITAASNIGWGINGNSN